MISSPIFTVAFYFVKFNVHVATDGGEVGENVSKGHSSSARWKPTERFNISFSCPVSEKVLENNF